MNPADELRKAAANERDEWGGAENARSYPKSSAIHLALADLLDRCASDARLRDVNQALTLARLINTAAEA